MFWKRKNPEPAPALVKQGVNIYSFMEGVSLDTGAALQEFINERAGNPKPPPAPEGAAMDSACGTAVAPINYQAVNPVVFAHYVATGQFVGYPALAYISQHWLVRKGCESKPRDAVRKWYEIETEGDDLDPEQIKKIEKLDRKFKLKANVVEGCTFNNIFGVRHLLFKNTDPDFDYSRPFNPDEFRGGRYAGIAQIDPERLTPEFDNEDLMDPMSMT